MEPCFLFFSSILLNIFRVASNGNWQMEDISSRRINTRDFRQVKDEIFRPLSLGLRNFLVRDMCLELLIQSIGCTEEDKAINFEDMEPACHNGQSRRQRQETS